MFETVRPSLSLDGAWGFVADPGFLCSTGSLAPGVPIDVPGPWEAQLREPYGIVHGWYRRRFAVPDAWRAGRLILRFGSVMARAAVWLDGTRIGEQPDGYVPFDVDAGEAEPGRTHVLVVEVVNPANVLTEYPAFGEEVLARARKRLGDIPFDDVPLGKQPWYTSTSGILGSVRVELAPALRFVSLLALPARDLRSATISWRLGTSPASDGIVELRATSPDGDTVARATVSSRDGSAELHIPNARRWDLDDPALYRVEATLIPGHGSAARGAARAATDSATVRFGMRSIAVERGEILLNGRPIYLRGALDQDFWPIGLSNPPSREAIERQATLAREMGLNLLRCHVKVPDSSYLDVADERGLLLWCELPSWRRFDEAAGLAAQRVLAGMVESMGHHPSVIAWTIVNEDWGTDLVHSARDRAWLAKTAAWLKSIDPTRLVVDNSASEATPAPNFHVRTDLADFHAYRSMPDGAPGWEALIEDLSRGPSWLWSQHGDAERTRDEALVLSEFGGWGLPRPTAARGGSSRDPWWWSSGRTFRRPAGAERRFEEQRLARVWPDVDALADATQWQQYHGLAAQIRTLRRHASIKGYVVTELSDTGWEANGLLDAWRRPKAYHSRLAEVNAPDMMVVVMPRQDLWGGERVTWPVVLSSFGDIDGSGPAEPAHLEWILQLAGGARVAGSAPIEAWPVGTARPIGSVGFEVPDVLEVTTGELRAMARDGGGDGRGSFRASVVVVPAASHGTARPRDLEAVDPPGIRSITRRLRGLGHRVVAPGGSPVVVTFRLDPDLLARVLAGATALVLARSGDAIPPGIVPGREVSVRARHPGEETRDDERPWDGDWTSVFAWALPGVVPGLTDGGLLGDPHREIYPDHVIDGLHPGAAADGVRVGIFAGWIHAPAALLADLRVGDGRLIVTTLRLAPEEGPIATALLEALVQSASGETRDETIRSPSFPTQRRRPAS